MPRRACVENHTTLGAYVLLEMLPSDSQFEILCVIIYKCVEVLPDETNVHLGICPIIEQVGSNGPENNSRTFPSGNRVQEA